MQKSVADTLSLDCKIANNFVEKTTCSNPKLLDLEHDLSEQLDHAEQVTKVPATVLTLSQQGWLNMRNQCKNTACIETSYQKRLQEIKNLNAMNQQYVQYFVRTRDNQPDPHTALLQIQSLDEKRVRILAQSFWSSHDGKHNQSVSFSGYANQAKRMTVRDLDTHCILKLRQKKNQWEIRQASPMCGNQNLRFSGMYQLQK